MAYTTINKSTDYFNTKLYTGNGSTQSITGVGFQPDMLWIKSRSGTQWHHLGDAVRGADKRLQPNDTGAESTLSTGITSFDSDGFSLGASGDVNGNGNTTVGWNWKAGGAGSANTDGSINSTVSVNTSSGFSIVKYTGNGASNDTATIGHGLGVAPNMIMVKCLNATGGWQTSSTSLGWNNVLQLNETNAQASGTYAFGQSGVTPTSTVFTVSATSGGNHTNTNNNTYIAYCFAEKTGYSKFGSYTGNGEYDGSFIYTGFKPAFVIYKGAVGSATVDNWEVADNKRSPFNGIENVLYPNLSNAEGTGVTTRMDMLSNGFKMRTNGTDYNGNGTTYIYMAFGQSLVGTNGVTAKAR